MPLCPSYNRGEFVERYARGPRAIVVSDLEPRDDPVTSELTLVVYPHHTGRPEVEKWYTRNLRRVGCSAPDEFEAALAAAILLGLVTEGEER
jgi:hypothetical protein